MSEKATVTMSTKSWHYKLVKLVLGSAAPTPQNMHNLCPYFWLMIFSLLVSPIVLPVRAVLWVVDSIADGISNFIMGSMTIPVANSWYDKLSDLDAYQIFQQDEQINKAYKKAFGDSDKWLNRDKFVFTWWEAKYGKKALTQKKDSDHMSYSKAFSNWSEDQREEMQKIRDLESDQAYQKRIKKVEYEEKMSNFRNGVDDFFDRISNTVSSWKNLIKWTKKIVGLIITTGGLIATYFVVNFLGRGVLWLVEHWDWHSVLIGGIVLAGVGAGIGIFFLLRAWVNYMNEKGTDLWYVKGLYYLAMVVYWPLKIIFYHFFWQLILVNLWFFIVKAGKLLWGSLLGFLGIFGEYFGASYTDYCPGIDWDENK